jgi:mono/diheme cytochrome c family protein
MPRPTKASYSGATIMAIPGNASTRSAVLGGIVGLLGVAAMARAAPAASSRPNLEPVATGRAVYQQFCASCHGARGEGARNWQQPDGRGELPAPPHGAGGHTWKHSDAMLYRIIQDGWRDAFNKTERLTMPAFRGQLSREQTIAVTAYLKALWTPKQRQFQAEESRGDAFPPEAP